VRKTLRGGAARPNLDESRGSGHFYHFSGSGGSCNPRSGWGWVLCPLVDHGTGAHHLVVIYDDHVLYPAGAHHEHYHFLYDDCHHAFDNYHDDDHILDNDYSYYDHYQHD
jgi:hypothetical protein